MKIWDNIPTQIMSSPARGTWIEILSASAAMVPADVVPRKGDVDRNSAYRRSAVSPLCVVPRKGDVDRNFWAGSRMVTLIRRPPQGGRG